MKKMNLDDEYVHWFKEWVFPVTVMLLCLLTAVAYVHEPIDTKQYRASAPEMTKPAAPQTGAAAPTPSAAQPDLVDAQPPERLFLNISLAFAVSVAFAWFIFSFTGDPNLRRSQGIKFAYFFVTASFAGLAIPPLVKSQAIGSEPLGIISGCVVDKKAPDIIKCGPVGTPKITAEALALEPSKVEQIVFGNNQWLVNIGGSLKSQSGRDCAVDEPKCKVGSMSNRAYVTGGLVIPLPFIMIALFGGAVSLSRRVPEIQKCSEPKYVGTANEPYLSPGEARERLLFQIMQFVSAPLIAIVAYEVLKPDSPASAAGLAFISGFGSETILLMIRGVVNGLQPRVTKEVAAKGTVKGTLTEAGQAAPNAEVSITGTALKTKTDVKGQYSIGDVPAGPQEIVFTLGAKKVAVKIVIIAGEVLVCNKDL